MGVNKKKGSQQLGESSNEHRADSVRLLATNQLQKERKDKWKKATSIEASADCDASESPNDLRVCRKRKAQISSEGNGTDIAMERRPADAGVSAKKQKHNKSCRQGHRTGKAVAADSKADSSEVESLPVKSQAKKIRSTAAAYRKCETVAFDPPTPAATAVNGHAVAKPKKTKRKQRGSSSHSEATESKGSTDTGSVTKSDSADGAGLVKCKDAVLVSAATVTDQANASNQKQQKKKKKKKDKKKAADQEVEKEKPTTSARDAALTYLDTWKRDRRSWSFQKVRQVWLLQHMYSAADVDQDRFEVLLEYLEPLKGNARAETVRKAEEILAKADENDVIETDDRTPAPVDELILLRAKEIVQHLSTE